jgi:putative protease
MKTPINKLEILAPCGSKQSFVTALRAGADAVYLGVEDFNARIAAHRLNLYDLEVMTDFAHTNNKKVYLALNILIKHDEINDVVKLLANIKHIKPDALIVQDLGLARIVKDYFGDLNLHASTQMSVHNSAGLEALKDMGFKRAVLARELTLPEIKTISNKSTVETEIFCHGALCFSVSGMCLFSSFLSGLSGNRGRCAQPCRRIWNMDDSKGFLFSPKDFQLAEFVQKIKQTKVKALKIEGRMRSSAYVYRVVKAYRLLVDAKEGDLEKATTEVLGILANDFAREKSTFLFSGRDPNLLDPENHHCHGKRIGELVRFDSERVYFNSNEKISDGDRVRISDSENDTTKTLKIEDLQLETKLDSSARKSLFPSSSAKAGDPGNCLSAKLDSPIKSGNDNINLYSSMCDIKDLSVGSSIFKISDIESDETGLEEDIDKMYTDYVKKRIKPEPRYSQSYTSLISSVWKNSKSSKESLWVRTDNPEWLNILFSENHAKQIIFNLTVENRYQFEEWKNLNPGRDVAIELPPYINERETDNWQKAIHSMLELGVKRLVLNNVAHISMTKGLNAELISGPYLYYLNAYSARVLKDAGMTKYIASWEDDLLNLFMMSKIGLGSEMIVFLYGKPVIVRSKMLKTGTPYAGKTVYSTTEDKKNVFDMGIENDSFILYPYNPVSNFNQRLKLAEKGITGFGIDLTCLEPSAAGFKELMNDYETGTNAENTCRFNMKQGLK